MRPLCRLCVNVSQFQLGVVFLEANMGMMNGIGHAGFEDKILQVVLKGIRNGESEDIIDISLGLVLETILFHMPQ